MLSLLFAAASFLSQPTLRGAHVGFYAIDLATHRTLADIRSDDAFVPASTMKLLIASAALDTLPADFSFETTLESAAAIDGSVLGGPVVLRGGGDASLDAAALDEAARAVSARGISAITGDVIADTSRYSGPLYPPGWVMDDLPYDYAAPVTALAFEDNAVALHVSPATLGAHARIEPDTLAGINVFNATATARGETTIDIARDVRNPLTIIVNGTIAPGAQADDEDAAIPDPATYAALRLRAALAARGVTVSGGTRIDTTAPSPILWSRHSGGLASTLRRFLLPSNNLMGEQLLNELGARAQGHDATDVRGIAAERAWLHAQGIDDTMLSISDGSGLSIYDRVSPKALVAILSHDWSGAHRDALLDALPKAAERGTLAHSFAGTPLAHVLVAKTGSMSHVRALAGYLLSGDRHIAFALLIDDWADGAAGAAARLDAARAEALTSLL